jgi:hypothetical protein
VLLAIMAAVNLLFVTRANAVDARRVLTVARAVGITPNEASAALASIRGAAGVSRWWSV